MNKFKITAIIIIYFPDIKTIAKTIESIYGQVNNVFIVDNTPAGSGLSDNRELFQGKNNIKFITLNENVGIARAQNIGIKKALAGKADFVLLSDDDTFYPDDYIAKMINAYFNIPNKEKVAEIVPDFSELNRGGERWGFLIFDGFFQRRINPQSGCHSITQAIASGAIIPAAMFDRVGFLDEKLFIDWVDCEWCWRARAKGFKIIGCADVVIEHYLGDEVKRVGSQRYSIRTPVRHYYIVRNAVYLALNSKYINFKMRLNLLVKSVKYTIGFTALGKPHWKHLRYCLKGFYHGVTNQLGAYR
jgi:rhamnosyltransferase